MNSEKILNNILKINFNIIDNFFKKTHFEDLKLEEKFQEDHFNKTIKNNFVSHLVIFLGYLATFLYISIAFFHNLYIINCSICFIISIISLIINSIFKSRQVRLINDHIQIFLSSLNILSKGYILCLYLNTVENDNVEEFLRKIIYDFFATNIYLITKLEANIYVSIFYFLLNFSLIILGYFYSNKNRYYFLEGFTSFCTFLIFYALRKQWDSKLRLIFADRIKFEKYYLYTVDYLEGLNGYNINIQNNRTIFYGTKLNTLLTSLARDNYLLDCDSYIESDKLEELKIKNDHIIKKEINQFQVRETNRGLVYEINNSLENDKNIIDPKNNENINIKNNINNKLKNYNNDYLTIEFLKKLTFYKKYRMQKNMTNNLNSNEIIEIKKSNIIYLISEF